MASRYCGRGSVVEHHLAKVRVASSNLVARSDKQAGQGPFSGALTGWDKISEGVLDTNWTRALRTIASKF
jgi:hypothetical protein